MPTPGNERNEAPPPGPLRRALRMLGGLVALPLGVLAFGTAPSCMGFGPPALALVGQCQTATAALGAPITQSYVGFSCGNAETEDDDGRASWRMPVAGSRGSGVLELDADERSGTWTFGHLVLTPSGGQPIDVLACAAGGTGLPARVVHEEHTGTVASAFGPAPVAVGASCRVQIDPVTDGAPTCRVVVTCADQTLYGSGTGGYGHCTTDAAGALVMRDTSTSAVDRDPMLDLSLGASSVTVSDQAASGLWALTILLAP
ncbi:MAG: cytochrome c oxidase assembly factor Coa1 family protein [Sandaracinus sp.]